MTDTITVLHYAAIVVLETYLIYSEVRLWKILERPSGAVEKHKEVNGWKYSK